MRSRRRQTRNQYRVEGRQEAIAGFGEGVTASGEMPAGRLSLSGIQVTVSVGRTVALGMATADPTAGNLNVGPAMMK